MGLGRRKRSVARVWLYDEKGDITVNDKPIGDFFTKDADKLLWQKPFHIVGVSHPAAKFSGSIKVRGGGKTGFIDAVVLGISRALLVYNEEFRAKLRVAGLLTRDSREVESKKVFLRKARKAPQYSKR
ncbi:30S ribosomal protein S9 [Patescibacteria group bacterium]|nr:30S ribosomal protein S9 [Patescibacteria group bacterium]MBU4381121.1 30S ribosomal protein S9 [Patescibacteria group bacterium]